VGSSGELFVGARRIIHRTGLSMAAFSGLRYDSLSQRV